MVFHCDFNLHFLMMNDIKYIFNMLICYLYIFGEVSIKCFSHFKKRLFVF